jgi:hypothetical protein
VLERRERGERREEEGRRGNTFFQHPIDSLIVLININLIDANTINNTGGGRSYDTKELQKLLLLCVVGVTSRI